MPTIFKLLIIGLFAMACEGQKKDNPTPSDPLDLAAADEGVGQADQNPAEQPTEVVEEVQEPVVEEEAPVEEPVEEVNTVLAVTPAVELPQRIADCVNQGVAGEVIDGSFTCNEQALIDCNGLLESQKVVALEYATENLAGFSLYGCSLSAEENPNLHYYIVEGVALRIFNLEVQKADPPAP